MSYIIARCLDAVATVTPAHREDDAGNAGHRDEKSPAGAGLQNRATGDFFGLVGRWYSGPANPSLNSR